MKRHTTSIILIVLVLGFVCWAYVSIQNDLKNGPLENPENLRTTIVASISNPFPQAHTLVLSTTWLTAPEEIPNTFNTCIDSSRYKNLLARKLHITILTNDEFGKIMDSVRQYRFKGEYPPSLWDTCRAGKVVADIKAIQLTTTKVKLYESYQYDNKENSVQKEFIFKNDHWSFNIVDTVTYINSKSK